MPVVTFACPECRKVLRSAKHLPAGKKIKCPSCEAVFPMPEEEDEELATGVSDRPRRPAAASTYDEDEPPRRRARRTQEEEEEEEKPRSRRQTREDEDEEEDEEDRPRRKKKQSAKRRSGGAVLLIGVVGVVLLLFLVVGGIGVYFIWFAGVNRGGGDEDPLAYAPPGTEVVIGIDVATLMSDPGLGPQVEQAMREQAKAGDFLDSCKKETGLEARDLFAKSVIFSDFDSLNSNNAAMPPPGMPGPGVGGGLPGGAPGAMPPPPAPPRRPRYTWVLRPSKEFDQKKMARSFKGAVQKSAHGKTYYDVNDGDLRTAFMPSNHTLVISTQPASELDALFTSDGKTPSVSADTVAMTRGVDQTLFWMVIPFEGKTRTRIDEAVRQQKADKNPDPLTPMVEQVARGKGVAIWSALEPNRVTFGVNLPAADATQALSLKQSAESAWNQQKLGIGVGAAALGRVLPKTATLLSEAIGNVTFSVEGSTAKVKLSVNRTTLTACIDELQKSQKQGGAGGGVNPGPGVAPRGGKPLPGQK
jgi:hypothetical protein